jgi:hypothetical protein
LSCVAAGLVIGVLICLFFTARPYTEISDEILKDISHSTNIVEALKKENLVLVRTVTGHERDTAEIVVEYDFLYKNSKKKNNEK